jgi:hypothetical protein
MKCPFCHYQNEDGALFCEQCKSDLAGTEMLGQPPQAVPAEAVPVASVVDESPFDFPKIKAAPPENEPLKLFPDPPMSLGPSASEPDRSSASPDLSPTAAKPAAGVPSASFPSAPAPPPAETPPLPAGALPMLVVLRGRKINVEYPLYEGHNFLGRADEKPVDIDLEDQEPPDRIWSSRQHAVITLEEDRLVIEDLNSSNGTFVNRIRLHPGQKLALQVNDIIQIGTVQMKVKV